MADPFVAEIRIFPFNFAPKGWATCDGQLLPLTRIPRCFHCWEPLTGEMANPILRYPISRAMQLCIRGRGRVFRSVSWVNKGGSEFVTLLISEMPAHTHLPVNAKGAGGQAKPANLIWGTSNAKNYQPIFMHPQ